MLEEIHLPDNTLRNNFIQYWNENDYANCLTILEESQLNNKKLVANIFNLITSFIVDLENNSDSSFKTNKIIVSSNAPSGLSSGDIWFEEII